MPLIRFSDEQIAVLLVERKMLPVRWEQRLLGLRITKEFSQKRSHLVLKGQQGEFQIFVRQNTINLFDFTVGIAFRKKNESGWFILKRYNGRHAPTHVNRRAGQAKEKIRTMHIHIATAEGQLRGNDLMAAISTQSYTDVYSAIEFALRDSNFEKPIKQENQNPGQGSLRLVPKKEK